jgi:hypothetical protein
MINNGHGHAKRSNVLDDTTHSVDHVYVRNKSCPPGWSNGKPGGKCNKRGKNTKVKLDTGG